MFVGTTVPLLLAVPCRGSRAEVDLPHVSQRVNWRSQAADYLLRPREIGPLHSRLRLGHDFMTEIPRWRRRLAPIDQEGEKSVRKIFRIAQLAGFLVGVGYIVVLLLGGRALTNLPFSREILVLRKQIAEVAVRLPTPAPIAPLPGETNEPSPSPESPEPSGSKVTAEPSPSRATVEPSPGPVTVEPSSAPVTAEPSSAPTEGATTGPPTARVDSISYATTGGKYNDLHLMIAITVVDASGKAISAATVSIEVLLDANKDGTYEYTAYAMRKGRTDSLGQVTLRVNEAPLGCYVTGVSGVRAADLMWDGVTPPNGPKCK
jgi:hypothetical protein